MAAPVTLGVVVVVLATAWLVSAVPPFLASIGAFPDALRIALEVLRWPVLALILAFAVRGLFQISAGYRADRLTRADRRVASLARSVRAVLVVHRELLEPSDGITNTVSFGARRSGSTQQCPRNGTATPSRAARFRSRQQSPPRRPSRARVFDIDWTL